MQVPCLTIGSRANNYCDRLRRMAVGRSEGLYLGGKVTLQFGPFFGLDALVDSRGRGWF